MTKPDVCYVLQMQQSSHGVGIAKPNLNSPSGNQQKVTLLMWPSTESTAELC